MRSRFALLLFVAWIMMAQAVDKGTIEGDVVNVSSGRGIPGAQVQLQAGDDKPLFTSTDERGHFRFENLALQIYQLQAHSPGMMNVPPERDAPAAAIVVLHRFRLHAEVRLELKPSESGIGKDGDDSGRRAQYRAAITIMPPQIHVADIDGEAISKLTGEPIAGVKISRQSRETVSVTTDMNGHFHMPGVPGLHSTLTATKSGFLRRSFEVAIKPEDSRITLKFEITPQAVIAGKVVNENGAPVPAARVTAALYRRVGGDRKLRGVEHAVTNDLGEYRLGNLPAGKYYVQAAAGITPLFRDARFALVYYPSAVDPRGASTIEVTAGQETHDIVLPMALHTGVEIRGRVIWPAGYEPSRQEYGHLRHEDPLAPINWPFPIASDGTFIVQFAPPGKYGISVEAGGDVERLQPPRYTAGRLLDVAGEKLEGVVLMPAATHLGELKGKIEIEGRSKTNVVPVGWIVLSSLSFEFKAEIEADGSFRIPSVGQGIYILGISPPPQYYVKSARFGTMDIRSGGSFEVGLGAPPIRIVIAEYPESMVAGTLTDAGGCPVSNVTVVFVPGESGDPITVPTDQRGGLAPRKIPPGEYRVYVVEDESSAYLAYDPDFTKAHQNDLPPVTVTPGDTPLLKLALPTKTKDSCQNE